MSTDIAPEKLTEYKRAALLREDRRQRASRQRRQTAWEVARQAAARLKEQFGASRVVAYGSIVHGHWFHPDSDIDLAAVGIPPVDFWRAWAALDPLDRSFEINLIDIEEASPELRRAIEETGVEL